MNIDFTNWTKRISTWLAALAASSTAAAGAFVLMPAEWRESFPGWAGSAFTLTAVLSAAGTVRAHWTPRVVFPARRLARGTYAFRVELAATMNPARTSVFVSRPFVVR